MLKKDTNAINKILLQPIVKFPTTDEQQNIKQRFYDRYGIPGAIDYIDCTHAEMIHPKNDSTENSTKCRSVYYMNSRR